ncbi:MAG: sigma-54-dependent transcriptional regulator [Myxococcota bacterium]
MSDVLQPPPRLLVVDDEEYVRRAMRRTLGRQGCDVVVAGDADEAMEQVRTHEIDICLLDMRLQDTTGVALMKQLRAFDDTLQCVIFTGDAGPDVAYEALAEGAADYFEKPIQDWGRFLGLLRTATRRRREALEDKATGRKRSRSGATAELVEALLKGRSPSMQALRREVGRLAPLSMSVLILGPTGSGKSHLARAIHAASGRMGDVEMINCALLGDANRAWSELFGHEKGAYTGAHDRFIGRFERASGRTVFLDEIGELPAEAQATLLHVLEEGVYRRMGGDTDLALSARVVAATNRDLYTAAGEGTFSDALLSRFDMVLRVPALSERPEDIPLLTWYFLRDLEATQGLAIKHVAPEVFEAFAAYDWADGNIRELRNVLKRMAVFAEDATLTVDLLPPKILQGSRVPRAAVVRERGTARVRGTDQGPVVELPARFQGLPYKDFKESVVAEYTRSYLNWCLAEAGGNITRAADRAEIRRPNFKRLMNRYDVEAPRGDSDL